MNRVRIGGRPAWPLALLVLLIAAAFAIVLMLRSDGARSDHGRALALYGAAARAANAKGGESEGGSRHGAEETDRGEPAGKEEADADKREAAPEIKGGEGGEGARHGSRTPWGEQVGNRAYPRTYVDDRIARRVHRNFKAIPASSKRSSFRSGTAFNKAAAAAPASWSQIGPVTPNVAGEASQFFDPVTQKGPATQESGRQTAIAVDPNCVPGNCRVWVAAAGGGIWRTPDALAAKPQWQAPDSALPTNSFGSLLYAGGDTIYAGSGEQNGSGDSEAGLGLFKSTDGGVSWQLVPGSADVATNRSIGSIAVDPTDPDTIYIGTAVARHGSSSVNGGRRTPPDAPQLGVYKSTDGGDTFDLQQDLSDKTPQNPTDPGAGTGSDWFQGGVNKMEFDPNDPGALYAAVLGYGIWRTTDGGTTWEQVFHTFNQTNFDDPDNPGDTFGDRTEFELVDTGAATRAYVGDSSDDGLPPDFIPEARVYRNDDVGALTGDPDGAFDNTNKWDELSNDQNGTNGFAAYDWCQNAQCGYDAFVTSPPGHPDEVWLGGSMNYDELPAYAGQPPRSNGRGVIRTTNGGDAKEDVTWQDMTVQLGSDGAWDPVNGLHPDQHAVGFSKDGSVAFVSSDGGLARIDVGTTEDRSGSCENRRYVYSTDPVQLNTADMFDCKELLSAIPSKVGPLNDGLADLQFQSLSYNPKNAGGELLGGTQDNGTWSFAGTPAWLESVGGDGGQSGFNAATPTVRFHNYFDATPEVNFHGNDPKTWLDIYDRLQETGEARSFYTPFIADPVVAGRLFTGLEHVWRAENNGGTEAELAPDCNALRLNPDRSECGNWVPIGQNLTGGFGGDRSGQYVAATERALSDSGTLWAATRTGRVFISKNADAAKPNQVKFTRLDDDSNTPERFVSGISIDPADPNHAWVSYSGYSAYTPSTPGHVFEVTYDPATRDSTWVDQSDNLDDEPVTDVALNGATGDVYASTDFGVLRLPKGSDQWVNAAPGLPEVAVYGITLAECDGLLYAATHGRSAYVLKLPKNNGRPCKNGPPNAGGGGQTPPPAGGGASVDTTKPKLTLRKIKRVRRPGRSVVKGRATDASGIRSVRVRWGDGKSTKAKVSSTGRFTVRHRYKKAKRFTLHVKATDKAGNSRTKTVHARVLKKRQAGA